MPVNKPYAVFGDNLDPEAMIQMDQAMALPVAMKGALMPDAHKGYGLPIGGVLAADNAVIPYAVGVDIACRVKLSVLPIPFENYDAMKGELKTVLNRETLFGAGQEYRRPKSHAVMDRDWNFSPVVTGLKDKAWHQLGTSGSGNHFAEFGRLSLNRPELGLPSGDYLALLTHSGSRGAGAAIAKHFSSLAQRRNPKLPKELKHLAWLPMDSEEGLIYFKAMTLMGHYSAANHDLIHTAILTALGESTAAVVENHHNFAFKEKIGLRDAVVHRKGAVPAARGMLGIIPGSMTAPAYVIRGKGCEESLNSSAHGAGRIMSRTAAFKRFGKHDLAAVLAKHQVTLISAGLDEIPMAYKDIDQVMAQQADLVEILARFEPRLVKMAPAGRSARKSGD